MKGPQGETCAPILCSDSAEIKTSDPLSLSATYLHQSSLLTPTSISSFSEEFDRKITPTAHTSSQFTFKTVFPVSKRFQKDLAAKSESSHFQSATDCVSKIAPHSIRSCHICNRRPTVVQDIPAYVNCEACGQRTCYICTRTCEGPRCHLNGIESSRSISHETARDGGRCKTVCSRCCIEVGVEGMIWCMVCYDDDADGQDHKQTKDKTELHHQREERVTNWLDCCGEDEQSVTGLH